MPVPTPGERLKELRSRLGITTRDVTEKSQQIADAKGNEEFYISHGWLSEIETTNVTPSFYKLYSISTIYDIRFADLLLLFGVDVRKAGKHQLDMPPDDTQLTSVEAGDSDRAITFRVRFDRDFLPDETTLLSRMVEVWGKVPTTLVQQLDVRNNHYGFIGLRDFTLYPLLRPGSFVQIDQKLQKIQTYEWRSEFDRPVYFVKLRHGYACSWCELQGNRLLLVPHPLSPCRTKQVVYGTGAEIVGQVTGVAMRITDTNERHDEVSPSPQLPKRS